MKLRIVPEEFENGGLGYTVSIFDDVIPEADACMDISVQDYLDALNEAILSQDLFRSRGEGTELCQGCDVCCGERMPLTAIDLRGLAQSPMVRESLEVDFEAAPEEALIKMVRRFCRIYVKGGTVDISLRLEEDGKCPFLNRQTKTCSVYDFRPFVCQAYICCPASKEALELRQAVVNAGEDELVRLVLNYAAQASMDLWYDEADAPSVNFEDWQPGPFSGKESYEQVMLKDILP